MSGFSQKRRFGNNDYNEPYRKKPRLPPIVALCKSLCADLNTLGESTQKYHEDVEFMSTAIVANFLNEKDFRDAVLNTFFAITTEQPQKIPHIAGLIQVVNSHNNLIGKSVIEFFHQRAQETISSATQKDVHPESYETGPWNKLKLILRLFSSLSFIINESGLTNLYKQFLNLAIDLQELSEKRNPLGEAIFYNTLTSLPYLTIFTPDYNPEAIQSITELAEGFKVKKNIVTITSPFRSNQVDIVSLILPAVKSQFERPQHIFIDFKDLLKGEQVEKHDLPDLSFPSLESLKKFSGLDFGLGSVDGMWRTPRLTFEVYQPKDGLATTPGFDTYFGLLIRDIVVDIVEAMEFNRKEVARQIITLDLFFRDGLFAPPGTSVDALKEISLKNSEEGTDLSTWKTEDVAVETVLSLIFKLPTASQPFVYFYTILVEACTNASQAIAPVMGRAIRFFYANLSNLDFELKLRYLDWLSIQLSNFNFTWKWREWESDSIRNTNSNYHPKVVFIRNLIAKELRLTNRLKVQGTLTEEFHKYLEMNLFGAEEIEDYYGSLLNNPEGVDFQFTDENSKFFYIRDNVPLKEKIEQLIEGIHKDDGSGEYATLLDGIKEEIKDYPNPEKLLISIVFQAISFVGNRSISHANKYISSVSKVLKSILEESSSSSKLEWAIEAVLIYWNKEPHNGFLVLDILEAAGVITSISKIEYLLKDDRSRNLGLVDISAIESILRSLTNVVYSGQSLDELNYSYKQLLSILSSCLDKLDIEEEIPIPDTEEEFSENTDILWKYETAMGFVKSLLRKFSDEFSGNADDLKKVTNIAVKHEPTISKISSWIDELKEL